MQIFTDMITYHSYNKNVFIKARVEGTKCVRAPFSLCPGISTVHKRRLYSYKKIALAVQSLTQSHYKMKGGTAQLIAIKLGKNTVCQTPVIFKKTKSGWGAGWGGGGHHQKQLWPCQVWQRLWCRILAQNWRKYQLLLRRETSTASLKMCTKSLSMILFIRITITETMSCTLPSAKKRSLFMSWTCA